MSKYIVGIDIGGTKVKFGVLSIEGEIIDKWEIHTNVIDSGASIIDDVWSSFSHHPLLTDPGSILGIGVGAPGFVDAQTGKVYEAVNIGWKDLELGEILRKKCAHPVYVENDANIAALGENWRGAGNQANDLIVITLGTGVGGGFIANGEILQGENGTAGEIGHIVIDPQGYACNCGRTGCLDTVASATGIVRQAMEEMALNPTGKLAALYAQQENISAKDVFTLAEDGDQACIRVIARITDALGMALANAAAIINPAKILIGGGLSQAGSWFLTDIRAAFIRHSLARIGEITQIEYAQLGNDAGIIGAAYLVRKHLAIE
ncbi:ROK family glucokinase [Paenibacillus sp. J2TS4]|uniref:ROK family glucokinase n=1 Tax=Paenibacillus sp. J2TS4 TaxID=2807194 RepID=UPI001B08F848|nr:ROK family glucokinase [Paenibacillus sp. J2TS4]GIP36104.1 glucokinase [Paenibacillus sp. J2TS4]